MLCFQTSFWTRNCVKHLRTQVEGVERMRISRTLTVLSVLIVLGAAACFASPVTIINNSTLGYYNQAIGNTLNGSAGFPATGDPTINPAPEPDMSLASAILGNWLTNPGSLNSNWSTAPQAIPS